MTHTLLRTQLRRYGRRVLGVGGASGLGWGVVVAAVVSLAGAWADLFLELTPLLRIVSLVSAVVAGAVVVAAAWRRALFWARPASLARRLDAIAGADGQIVAGVDLVERPRDLGVLESGLAEIAVARAAELAKDLPGRRVASGRPILISSLAIGGIACALALLALVQPRMARTLWLRFSDPFGDHPPYSSIVLRVAPGDVKVVYGQGVEIRATVEGGASDRVELWLEPAGAAPERLPMFPEGEGKWRAAVADVTSAGRYVVRSGRARSARYRIDVVTVPRIEGVRFRVTPPAYTHQAAYEGPAPSEGLAGLAGTRVDVWATSNRPLGSGSIQATAGMGREEHALAPTSPGSKDVYGSFAIRGDGKVAIGVTDREGQGSLETFSTSVTLLRDERPLVRLIEPRETSFATPDAPLPVVIAAEDDYGISRLQLYRSLNGSRALPIELSIGNQAPNRWNEQVDLPLSEYGLRPGDEIKLFARVEDNDPAGSKGTESSIVTVRIIPREVFERLTAAREGIESLTAKYREAERRMEAIAEEISRLQEELAKLPADSPLAREQREKLDKLAKQMREQAAAISESARHPMPIDLDKNLSRELEALANALASLATEAEANAKEPSAKNGEAAKTLAELRRRLAEGRKQFGEDATAPVEHFAKIFPLLADQSRFLQIYLRQRALADRMASLKGRDNEDNPALKARMRDLEAEQREIRSALADLLDDIDEHVRLLPDDPRLNRLRATATAFVAAVRASGASEAMSDAEAGLAAFNGTRGAASSKEAADILERLLARSQGSEGMGGQGQAALQFQPKLAGMMGDSLAQMLANAGLPGSRPGEADGAAGRDGYSSRQNNLDNVGLYGTRPTLAASSRQGSGRSNNPSAPGGVGGGPRGDRKVSDLLSANKGQQATGQAPAPVPTRYQRRVADYFQRIADETGPR